MAVTLPSAASLGASGVCIVHNAKTRGGRGLRLRPGYSAGRGARHPDHGAERRARGHADACAAMARCRGRRWWPRASGWRGCGVPVSRGTVARPAGRRGGAGRRQRASRIFSRGSGDGGDRGRQSVQTDLAATLGVIRQRGGGEFFSGSLGRLMSDQVTQIGGNLPAREQCATRYRKPAHPRARATAGSGSMSRRRQWRARRRSPDGRARRDGPGTGKLGRRLGIAAIDTKGGAAACSLSMGQLFGAR